MADVQQQDEAALAQRRDLVESKINPERMGEIALADSGAVTANNMLKVFEYAKLMSLAQAAIPPFLRGNPWDCLAVITQASEWNMSAFSVARMAYVSYDKNGVVSTITYQSQLIHAVIEQRAPIEGRLKVRYEGEGDDRVCIVSAKLKALVGGEVIEYRSPRLGDRRPKVKKGRDKNGNDYEYTQGSPLWITKPDLQQFYDASRDFARMHFPDVLMGIYAEDEMAEQGFETRQDRRLPAMQQVEQEQRLETRLTPQAMERAGFVAGDVVAAVDAVAAQATATETEAKPEPEKAKKGGGKKAVKPEPAQEPQGAPPAAVEAQGAQEPVDVVAEASAEMEARREANAAAEAERQEAETKTAAPAPAEKLEQEAAETSVGGPTETELAAAHKAGGRAYFNGLARASGKKQYPDDEKGLLLAAWQKGYDERRDHEIGAGR